MRKYVSITAALISDKCVLVSLMFIFRNKNVRLLFEPKDWFGLPNQTECLFLANLLINKTEICSSPSQ